MVDHPTGKATLSTPFEYHYLSDRVATFTPDAPGTYEIQVTARTIWEDPVTSKVNAKATWTTKISAQGQAAKALGCESAGGAGGLATILVFGLGFIGLTRRRKK